MPTNINRRPLLCNTRCVWQDETWPGEPVAVSSPAASRGPAELPIEEDSELNLPSSPGLRRLPRIRLPAEIVHRLRAMAERQAPQVRPSIK